MKRIFTSILLITFLIQTLFANVSLAQTLPLTINPVQLTQPFLPTMVRGLMLYPDNPLKFNFLIEPGNEPLSDQDFQKESAKLIRYFLASLTTPEEDMWVNLSPTEKDRIIPASFGTTEMGRDLLAQDYILKQLTAALMNPDEKLGKEFWNRVYEEVHSKYGDAEIPVDTLSKVWIVPDKAEVFIKDKTVVVVESHLKVMMEEDYKSDQRSVVSDQKKENSNQPLKTDHLQLTTQIMKQIILPAIEHEVNTGKNFAPLRQIQNSAILAAWYKKNLRESLLGKSYIDQKKVNGIESGEKDSAQKIYDQYLKAFKQGAYEAVKEDYNSETQEVVMRKYVTGGAKIADSAVLSEAKRDSAMTTVKSMGPVRSVELELKNTGNTASPNQVNDEEEPELTWADVEKQGFRYEEKIEQSPLDGPVMVHYDVLRGQDYLGTVSLAKYPLLKIVKGNYLFPEFPQDGQRGRGRAFLKEILSKYKGYHFIFHGNDKVRQAMKSFKDEHIVVSPSEEPLVYHNAEFGKWIDRLEKNPLLRKLSARNQQVLLNYLGTVTIWGNIPDAAMGAGENLAVKSANGRIKTWKVRTISPYGLKRSEINGQTKIKIQRLAEYFSKNKISKDDAEILANTIVRIQPKHAELLVAWGVLMPDESAAILKGEFSPNQDFVDRMIKLIRYYDTQPFKTKKEILLRRLAPQQILESAGRKVHKDWVMEKLLRFRFGTFVEIDRAVEFVNRYQNILGGSRNAWELLIRKDLDAAEEWMRIHLEEKKAKPDHDDAMFAYTPEEWKKIEFTMKTVKSLAHEIRLYLNYTLGEEFLNEVRAWLDTVPGSQEAVARLSDEEKLKLMNAGVEIFKKHKDKMYEVINFVRLMDDSIYSGAGASKMVSFQSKGKRKLQADDLRNVTYDFGDSLGKAFGIVIAEIGLSTALNPSPKRVMNFRQSAHAFMKRMEKYYELLKHAEHPETMPPKFISRLTRSAKYSRESNGFPENTYRYFLIPYLKAMEHRKYKAEEILVFNDKDDIKERIKRAEEVTDTYQFKLAAARTRAVQFIRDFKFGNIEISRGRAATFQLSSAGFDPGDGFTHAFDHIADALNGADLKVLKFSNGQKYSKERVFVSPSSKAIYFDENFLKSIMSQTQISDRFENVGLMITLLGYAAASLTEYKEYPAITYARVIDPKIDEQLTDVMHGLIKTHDAAMRALQKSNQYGENALMILEDNEGRRFVIRFKQIGIQRYINIYHLNNEQEQIAGTVNYEVQEGFINRVNAPTIKAQLASMMFYDYSDSRTKNEDFSWRKNKERPIEIKDGYQNKGLGALLLTIAMSESQHQGNAEYFRVSEACSQYEFYERAAGLTYLGAGVLLGKFTNSALFKVSDILKKHQFKKVDTFVDWVTDAAMFGKNNDLGGIDLNPNQNELKESGTSIDFKNFYGPANFRPEQMNVNGFVPVILNISPPVSLPLLLGIREKEKPTESLVQAVSG